MSVLLPTRLALLVPDLAKPCPGCGRVWCTCPRKDWDVTVPAATRLTDNEKWPRK